MTLKLEYECTAAEIRDAQSLLARAQWRQWLKPPVYIVICMASWAYLTAKPEDRAWDSLGVAASIAVISAVVYFLNRRRGKNVPGSVQLEVSEQGLSFIKDIQAQLAWTGFGRCLESPALFVLVNRQKTLLYTIPKRAFPDQAAQDWFRATAALAIHSAFSVKSIEPQPVSARGVTLTMRWTYRDYLIRMVTSWRIKGMAFGILALVLGTAFVSPESPNAVRSKSEAIVFILVTVVPMVILIFPGAAFLAWSIERKQRSPQRLTFSNEGIEGWTSNGHITLPWSTYQFYLENRWTFIIWKPNNGLWLMLPKREFATALDVAECRKLLQANLRASRWFFTG